MKQTKVKKKVSSSKRKNSFSHLIVGYTVVLIGGVLLIVVALATYQWVQNGHVLGMSTFLAQDGSDGNTAGSSGETREGMPPQIHSNTTENSGKPVTNEEHQTVSGVTIVTCIGPDKKTFQTSAFNCEYLNHAWHNSVRFTSESAKPRPPRPTGAVGTEKHTTILRPHKPE